MCVDEELLVPANALFLHGLELLTLKDWKQLVDILLSLFHFNNLATTLAGHECCVACESPGDLPIGLWAEKRGAGEQFQEGW